MDDPQYNGVGISSAFRRAHPFIRFLILIGAIIAALALALLIGIVLALTRAN
jgi:hypothetical protein